MRLPLWNTVFVTDVLRERERSPRVPVNTVYGNTVRLRRLVRIRWN